jgi:hypothetical protein
MSNNLKKTLSSLLFSIIRILPIFSALTFCDLTNTPFERVSRILDSLLRAAIILIFWRMTEGVFMLWVREKNNGSQKVRGYGAVTIIIALLVLLLLQVFRSQSTQKEFLMLLFGLALSGMARSGWEQGRPLIAHLAAPASHFILSLLSFTLVLDRLSWQAVTIALSIGLLTGSVESTWYGATFATRYQKWVLPFYRASISFPALAIGSLAMLKHLPNPYMYTFAFLIATTRFTWNKGHNREILNSNASKLIAIHLAFIALLVLAQRLS